MIIPIILFSLLAVLIWVDEKDALRKVISPKYGGIPVELNQMLLAAHANGDDETKAEVHRQRKIHFRNRRTSDELSISELDLREKFITKYGDAGRAALKHDDTQRKIASLTRQEKDEILAKYLEENETKPVKKEPTHGQ